MAWGYRLEGLGSRSAARHRETGRECAVGACATSPLYTSSYRYMRKQGRVVTVTRNLCAKHAMLFSMKYSVAWPGMFRRIRRPAAATWTAALAA